MKALLESAKHNTMMVVCVGVMVVAFAIYASGIPLGSLAPFAMLIVCPLMHVLMMRGHGSHGADGQASCHQTRAVPVETASRKES